MNNSFHSFRHTRSQTVRSPHWLCTVHCSDNRLHFIDYVRLMPGTFICIDVCKLDGISVCAVKTILMDNSWTRAKGHRRQCEDHVCKSYWKAVKLRLCVHVCALTLVFTALPKTNIYYSVLCLNPVYGCSCYQSRIFCLYFWQFAGDWRQDLQRLHSKMQTPDQHQKWKGQKIRVCKKEK